MNFLYRHSRKLAYNFFKMSDDKNYCSWSGVPINEMYGSNSPWGAPEFPLISASYNHAVLFNLSDDAKDRPPGPKAGQDHWDSDHVRMPCSSHSLYPVFGDNGQSTLKQRWGLIQEALSKPILNTEDLAAAILSYNTKFISVWKFGALHNLFNEFLEEEESKYFFDITLPEIVKLALLLPKLIPSAIPLLKRHRNRSISLSQQQIACLLANAFFCTFPRRNTAKRTSEYASYPYINFNMLYESVGSSSVLEKLKCICHYFRRVCTKVPVGVMTFIRHTVPPEKCPEWSQCTKFIGGTPLHVDSEGTIEDGDGLIQVDFANRFLGGGVLRRGCVQEEIRFVICPELLISMLFTEVLDKTEALLMIGCERYSNYTGYGHTFQWSGNFQDSTPFDSCHRKRCAVLAIDAYPFRRKMLQYETESITRELNKAWVGVSAFVCSHDTSRVVYPGVGTGNWGCGAFGGNAHLKGLLQLMACTEARRPIAYYTFGDLELRNDLIFMYNLLSKHNVTVGQLYKYIIQYKPSKDKKKFCDLHKFLRELIAPEDIMETNQDTFVSPWTSKNFSPDLFEDDEDDISPTFLYKNTDTVNTPNSPKNTNKQSNIIKESEAIRKSIEDKKLESEKVAYKNKSDTLFDEMTKFDIEQGKLNLNENKIAVNQLSGLNESINESIDKMEVDVTNTSIGKINTEDSQKRKLDRKITDYFRKKPT